VYNGKITLLTTIWKRRKHLEEFISRWLAQPQIDEIIIWNNGEFYQNDNSKIVVINSSHNYGGYIRDVASHFAKNDVVMVTDDDIFVEPDFVAQMAQYYEDDNCFLGLWGKNFRESYLDANVIKATDISKPTPVECMVGLIYMIHRKHLFPVDHRDLMWTCYDIHLSGIFHKYYPQIKKIVVPNKLWHLTEEEEDKWALNRHPDALKEKQAVYERYYKR
jgi:hypothetical protein